MIAHPDKDAPGGIRFRLVQSVEGEASGAEIRREGLSTDSNGQAALESYAGLSVRQLCWLEASLWPLIWQPLERFGADVDPEALSEASDVVESGKVGVRTSQ